MSNFERLSAEDHARFEAAAAWSIRLRDTPSHEMSAGFMEWISDPLNREAYDAVLETMLVLDDFSSTPNILDMRRSALRRLRYAGTKQWLPRRLILGAVAAGILALLASSLVFYITGHRALDYATGIGERRIVALADGSHIFLDADSEVTVHYTDAARIITLVKGRSRFDVAHDVSRPFTVSSNGKTVVAVGTVFIVDKLGPKLVVTLVHGRVTVKRTQGSNNGSLASGYPVSMVSGDQLVAAGNSKPVLTQVNLNDADAWESGLLVFRGEPLGDAVDQVNRYTRYPIIVESSVSRILVSGVFNAGDIGSFVSAITSYFPVEMTTDGADHIILKRKS